MLPVSQLPVACALALGVGLASAPGAAESFDWSPYADAKRVRVVTSDEDGDLRKTTIWMVVLEGSAYIRTGGSRWGRNLRRDPQLVLRVEEAEIPARVEFVDDEAERGRIVQAFRDKYGFTDRFIGLFRGGSPLIMRLTPR